MLSDGILLVLAAMGLFQGAFLSFYLLTLKKGNRRSNLFLGLVLLGLTIRIGKSVINYYVPLEAWQRNIGISGILISGPFLWFYGMTLLEKNKPFANSMYLHLAPFALFLLLLPVIPSNGPFELYWNYGLMVYHLAIYLILSWILWYNNRLKASKTVLGWYRNILLGVSLVWGFYLANFLILNIFYITGPIFYTFMIYAFFYVFLNRHNFHLEKYGSSNLDRPTSKDLYQKIKTLFTEEAIYLDPEITLKTVAEKFAINPRMISQAINENEQLNFNEFVNRYRIGKAKTLLANPEYKSEKLATIAYDSGFGNVTSFNIAFKKITGITPSMYRRQHLSS
jgi:AraC-like DNA-binding protein